MDLQELFLNMFTNNKIGHAYLIGNIKYENAKEDLNFIFSKFIFNNEEVIENDPDLYLISPENLSITKEQIKQLQGELHKTSQYHNKKIYVISECEKLNPYAANSLLKILEEPSKNIYAFFPIHTVRIVNPCMPVIAMDDFFHSYIIRVRLYRMHWHEHTVTKCVWSRRRIICSVIFKRPFRNVAYCPSVF